jgi:magnesium transporter
LQDIRGDGDERDGVCDESADEPIMSLLSRAADEISHVAGEADRLLRGERLRPPSTIVLPTPVMSPGAHPGTLFADPDAAPTHIAWMRFAANFYDHGDLAPHQTVSDLQPQPGQVLWIDVRGTGDRDRLQAIGDLLGVHPLALADMVNVPQRPKTDVYDQHTLCVSHMIHLDGMSAHAEQISVLLGDTWVLTIQESDQDGDVLEPVRARIAVGKGRMRQSGPDYLAYAILDCVIDGYFPVLEQLGVALEELEQEALDRPEPATGKRIHALKRTLLVVRRSIWPQRDALHALLRTDAEDEHVHITEHTRVYLRDAADHAVHVVDLVETYREFAASLMDVYLSAVNNRMNEVVKVLTIISTIFLPLTFIAGIYGMNFEYMPELKWQYGYAFAMVLMAAVAIGMLYVFYRMGWIGTRLAARRRAAEAREHDLEGKQ